MKLRYDAPIMSQTRFDVGDLVHWTAVAARMFGNETGVVVEVVTNKDGVEALDQYRVVHSDGHDGIYYAAELQKAPGRLVQVWHSRRANA
jgi:hypothetical protein